MQNRKRRSCLIVTYGPVPTPQYQTVEGGGMRAWGLAQGLLENNCDVTVAVNQSFPQEINTHEEVHLVNWSLDDQFADLINSYDSVIVSYCLGDPSVFIASHINDDVQLILDVYVPIYIEVSARESDDKDQEYQNYFSDLERHNKVLQRGDYFLCAHSTQKTFYTGVLSSLGIINPRSYREDRVLVVPFGIHGAPAESKNNPYKKLGFKKDDFIVLWFGGLYPWFRIEEFLESVRDLASETHIKFVIVGGKNPFNPHSDFNKQYEKAVSFAEDNDLLENNIFFVDWVDFEKRNDWYSHADVVISLNNPGEENQFSWRTRVMDYIWGGLAILTNGGDPLSEQLLENNAAIKLTDLSSKNIVSAITNLSRNRKTLEEIQSRVRNMRKQYYWNEVTRPLLNLISENLLPYKAELTYKKKFGLDKEKQLSKSEAFTSTNKWLSRARRLVRAVPRIFTHIQQKGIRKTARLVFDILKTQISMRLLNKQRRYFFISHPIDNTGAPMVLIQIIEEFADAFGPKNIRLVAPHISPNNLRRLRRRGIKVYNAPQALGLRLIKLQLGIRKNDFVLMNTIAIPENYRAYIYKRLLKNKLEKVLWFIHEDKAQLKVIGENFLSKQTLEQTHLLAESKKLRILVPSMQTKRDYDEILHTKLTEVIDLRVTVDEQFTGPRDEGDYSRIDFFISGTPSDGRKGQMIAISALHEFIKTYYEQSPDKYRDFKLHLLSIDEDYISQQIRWIGSSLLGPHIKLYPHTTRDEALSITAQCNAVICCSLNETFALYVAEGMFMGHVVLRNDTAGVDEQLKDGVNGYRISNDDIIDFSATLEKILNKHVTSDKDLQKMGKASQKIIKKYATNTYADKLLKNS